MPGLGEGFKRARVWRFKIGSQLNAPPPLHSVNHTCSSDACSAAQLGAAGITEEVLARQISLIRRQVRLFSSNEHVRALQAGMRFYKYEHARTRYAFSAVLSLPEPGLHFMQV